MKKRRTQSQIVNDREAARVSKLGRKIDINLAIIEQLISVLFRRKA